MTQTLDDIIADEKRAAETMLAFANAAQGRIRECVARFEQRDSRRRQLLRSDAVSDAT